MCGIYGIFDKSDARRHQNLIGSMGQRMVHRGPDDFGEFIDDHIAMGMRRLSIIDVAGGHQPIFNENKTIVTVCNGEIYNFQSLREELRSKGHSFSTGSDTEVIVHLYEEYGDDFVVQLSGMFSLALWDIPRQRLLLARDRLGIKPLYVTEIGSQLLFASEIKSILEHPDVKREIDPAALTEFLTLGYVPAPMSMIRGVQKLMPGYYLVADRQGVSRRRYWKLPDAATEQRTEQEWVSEIASTLEASVTSQMVSDVPLGAFLSGGVDSSAVVAYMAKNSNQPVKTYSIGFDTESGGSYYNELPYARQVAEQFGTDHHEIVVRPDVATLMPELLWHMDEPVADAAYITTYLVSKFAREDVTVILSGVGGDELFGGYRRYWSENLVSKYRKIPSILRNGILQPVGRILPSDRNSRMLDWSRLAKGFLAGAELPADQRYEKFVGVFDDAEIRELFGDSVSGSSGALKAAFAQASSGDPIRRLMDVDLLTQLPDDLLMLTDRMSMATSLECRVPLLDDKLVELSCRMPSSMKVNGTKLKYALKNALRGVLTDDIIDRKKRGFGAPIGGWFKSELSGYLDSILSKDVVEARGLFNWQYIEKMKALHRSNREDLTDNLSALVNLEIWSQMYLDGDTPDAVVDRLHRAEAA